MEFLSTKLTDYILSKKVIQKEDYEIYQYGFQYFLELSINIICSIIIALLLDMKLECILFFLFFIPLRSYSGGLHMERYNTCLFFSCITLIIVLLMVRLWNAPYLVSIIIYLTSFSLIKAVGSVNHPNRKVGAEENNQFIKKTNFVLLLSLFIAVLFLIIQAKQYLFLESLVFALVAITSFIGKCKYTS